VLFDALPVPDTSSKVSRKLSTTALDALKSSMTIEQVPRVKVLFQMKMILDPYSCTDISPSASDPEPELHFELKPTTVLQKGFQISDLAFACFRHHVLVSDTESFGP
jgi:hypothetical protein